MGAVLALCVGGLAGAESASAATSLRMVGAASTMPAGARLLGPVSASESLHATVALNPSSSAALEQFATAVSTPGDPEYGHYLSVAEFASRFGATADALGAVERDLRGAGLQITEVPPDHLSVEVTGSAAEVERAFATDLEQVRMTSGRIAYLNEDPPAVPAAIAPEVQGVIGLSDLYPAQPQDLIRVPASPAPGRAAAPAAVGSGPAPCTSASALTTVANGYGPSGAGEAYTADLVAGMYGLGGYYPADEGAGQTVALVELEAFQQTDVTTYQSCYGLPTTAPTVINVDGGPGTYTTATDDDDGEAALDIEQVIGLAPEATVDVYQGNPTAASAPTDILSQIVSDDKAKVISSSWGVCEALAGAAQIAEEDTLMQEAATQGQSFFGSSGDSGSTMCYQATRTERTPNISLSVIDPGAQPFATGVGGTSLGEVVGSGPSESWVLPTNGAHAPEVVWNDGVPGGVFGDEASATGGGVSDQWPMPAYQSSAASTLDVIQAGSSKNCSGSYCREVPDVSADADPNSGYAIYANGGNTHDAPYTGWLDFGGTSASAPLWAAFIALVNASPACNGETVGFVNPALYKIASSSYAGDFHNISQASPFTLLANNDVFGGGNPDNPDELYPVGPGYSMATGLGTPIGSALGPALCAVRATTYTVSVASPGPQSWTLFKPVSVQMTATDSGAGTTLSYSATGLPAGMSISSTGLITGTPTTVDSGTATVAATDQYSNTASAEFTWTVVSPPSPPATPPAPTPPAPTPAAPTPPAPTPAAPVTPTPTSAKQEPPTLSASLRNVKLGKAAVSVRLAAGANAPALAEVVISLPKGLTFSRKASSLRKGLSATFGSAKLHFTIGGGGRTLTLRFATAEPDAVITVGTPAIVESSGLRQRAKAGKVKHVALTIEVIDAHGTSTRLSATVRV